MKINSALKRTITKALTESTETETMVRIMRQLIPFYDIYQRSGFPVNIPMPTQDAANQIVYDLVAEGLLIPFIVTLIDVYQNGLMGKKIQIKQLPQILKEMGNAGLTYNPKTRNFDENSNKQKTRGWGVLQEGQVYEFAFLRLDIVGNTKLVRKYPRPLIIETYSEIKAIVRRMVEKRNGRIWEWEGDGGFAAFHFEDKNRKAILAGIEILNELLLFNLFDCQLTEGLSVRMAIHTGPCHFSTEAKVMQNSTLKKLEILESQYSEPNTLTVSPGVYSDLGQKLEKAFEEITLDGGNSVYRYCIRWEE